MINNRSFRDCNAEIEMNLIIYIRIIVSVMQQYNSSHFMNSHFMNSLCWQKNLSWLEARIRETEFRLNSQKKHLDELESQGINTAQACQSLAITTDYLKILNVRRQALIEKLDHAHDVSHRGH